MSVSGKKRGSFSLCLRTASVHQKSNFHFPNFHSFILSQGTAKKSHGEESRKAVGAV
jgi:hypothetical protein